MRTSSRHGWEPNALVPPKGTPIPSPLTIAVRAHAPRVKKRKRRGKNGRLTESTVAQVERWPRHVLIFDTETTVDPSQALLYGCYQVCRWDEDGSLICDEEGLCYADDLEATNPAGFKCIHQYYANKRFASDRPLLLLTREQFVTEVFYPAAYKARALVVGFNLPFDLSRIAVGSGRARSRSFLGGFSLKLAEYVNPVSGKVGDNLLWPRVCVLHRNRRSSFIGFSGVKKGDEIDRIREDSHGSDPQPTYLFRGHFLDLKTFLGAIADRSFSVKTAALAFKTELQKQELAEYGVISGRSLDYVRNDVALSAQLLEKGRNEYDSHPIALPPTEVASSASIAKGYLTAMGITPYETRAKRITNRELGIAASGFFGGRAEARIRLQPMPVVYLDFLSMYSTVNALLGFSRALVANEVYFEDATEEVREFLASVTLDDVFKPGTWEKLPGFGEIIPNGDILPVRARYDDASDEFTIGVNPLHSPFSAWYPLADLVASTILTGRPPQLVRALRLRWRGEAPSITPVDLGGVARIDPAKDDIFRRVIEERKRSAIREDLDQEQRERLDKFLKVLANSGGFGIYSELNPETLPSGRTAEVDVYASGIERRVKVPRPEKPGQFCFMPVAANITAGARLMLAALETCVTDQGSSYVACDTDSMIVVSTPSGGLVPCKDGPQRMPDGRKAIHSLSFEQVDRLVARFDQLHPYDRTLVPESILKIDKVNFDPATGERLALECVGISAKRYALFTRDPQGKPVLRDYKESVLGRFLNPTDPELDEDDERKSWIEPAWEYMLSKILGVPSAEPAWLDRPALSQETLTTPNEAERLSKANGGNSYATRLKPFGFVMAAQVDPVYLPSEPGIDRSRFRLLAALNTDPRQWTKVRWTDTYTGKPYRITTGKRFGTTTARVKSYRDVLHEYPRHPEHKTLAGTGGPCEPDTVGLLLRRPVYAVRRVTIGKQAHKLEEVESGKIGDIEEVETVYGNLDDSLTDLEQHLLRELPREFVALICEISERQVSKLRTGKARMSRKTRELFMSWVQCWELSP